MNPGARTSPATTRPDQPASRRQALRLAVLASAAAGPWGTDQADLLRHLDVPVGAATTPDLPAVPGFVESTFNPLVHEVARQCLTGRVRAGAGTAVVLASVMGDATTTDLASQLLVAGQVHNPLLFMQATANAVLGFVSREFGITGPMSVLSPPDGLAVPLLLTADLLLADPELDRVLLLGVELAGTKRTEHAYRRLAEQGGRAHPPAADVAAAVLVAREPVQPGPPVWITGVGPAAVAAADPAAPPHLTTDHVGRCGSAQGLVQLAAAHALVAGGHADALLVPDPAARDELALIELAGPATLGWSTQDKEGTP
ncbi:hypothetical protein [Goodfellowiella coeruleoviolacea]|uniref:Beta-ketoacyl synthase N-terminal domain-containing protein n=1 Tax=Goodfellowiella coeruleoviolacea TaxID=334858 RepID=A0AAE3KEA5_9PSEU|nr:hypothetical protein [Goodfellowiella coeruleoviolacea]MCP2163655.1 hypothetical protein [Goodfellowiella coeruleoviolacea]